MIPRRLIRSLFVVMGPAMLAGAVAAQVPAAPSNVRLTIVRDNAIDVFWQDNSNNEAAFDVFRRAGAGSYTLLGAVDANITLFQDRNSGIRPNVEFCYRVAARNGFGSSPQSEESCVTVPPRPNAPSDLQLSRASTTSPVVLSWTDNASNETSFLVYRDTDGAAFVLFDTVAADVTTYSDVLLRTGGNYCYFVSAINRAGESPGTDPACLDVVIGLPVPPTGTTAETVSDLEIRVNWVFDVLNFATLFVERSDDGQASWSDVFQTGNVVEEFTDRDLTPNTEYCYRVRVENETEVPSFSTSACAVTEYSVPDVPAGLTAEGLEGRSIGVSWEPVSSARILYRLERQAGDTAFKLAADSVDGTSIVETGLDPDSVYCYRVRSFNPEFFSEWSEAACGIVAPDAVVSLSATPDPADRTTGIIVTWQQGSDVAATSFRVSYRETGEGTFSDPIVVTDAEAAFSGLSDATEYEVAVQSVRVVDETSAQSSAKTATVRTFLSFWPGDVNGDGQVTAEDVVSLTAPACFGATTGFSTGGLSVAWAEIAVDVGNQDPGVLRCDTDRTGSVNVFDFLAIAANAGRTTGKSGALEPAAIIDEAHLARILTLYESFRPADGNAAQVRLKEDLGRIVNKYTGDLPDEIALREAYPNPASSRFHATVELPRSARVNATLVNERGQVVGRMGGETFAAGRRTLDFNVADLAPGVYFLVVEAGGKRLTKAVTVVR